MEKKTLELISEGHDWGTHIEGHTYGFYVQGDEFRCEARTERWGFLESSSSPPKEETKELFVLSISDAELLRDFLTYALSDHNSGN